MVLLLLWSSIHRQLVAGARGWRVAAVSIGVASAAFWAAAIAIELSDPGSASDPVATVALVALMLSFAACVAIQRAAFLAVTLAFLFVAVRAAFLADGFAALLAVAAALSFLPSGPRPVLASVFT